MSILRAEPLGEDALLLRLGDGVDAAINARVHGLAAGLAAQRPPWLLDIVPAYCSLALFIDTSAFADGDDPQAEASAWLASLSLPDATGADAARTVEIPVAYGGDDGPDLAAVAAHSGLSADDVVALHSGADYRVAMLGFAPGFPYLLGLDPRLAMPRHDTPRVRVPAGSVGIGGAQAGIYPRAGPGGWQLIGRTATPLFDAARNPPATLLPGDRVRFVPVSAHAQRGSAP